MQQAGGKDNDGWMEYVNAEGVVGKESFEAALMIVGFAVDDKETIANCHAGEGFPETKSDRQQSSTERMGWDIAKGSGHFCVGDGKPKKEPGWENGHQPA